MSEESAASSGTGDIQNSNGQPAPSGLESEAAPAAPRYLAQTSRAIILATGAACFAAFWVVGSLLDVPQNRRFEVSLLQQPTAKAVLDLIVAALLLAACTITGHFIAGRRWLYAGPFVATFGLMAWSYRGGPSRYVYQHAAVAGDGRSIFLVLALELAILSLFVGTVWFFIATRGQALAALADTPATVTPRGDLTLLRLQAIGAQVLMTALLVMFLTPVDAKKGVLAAVFFASFIAASLTEYFFAKAELDAWYWVGPAVTGVIGYLLNCFDNAAGAPFVSGHLMGAFAPLSRPLPLDYASAGMFAALLGFWTGGEHPEIAVGMLLFDPGMSVHGLKRQAKSVRARAV